MAQAYWWTRRGGGVHEFSDMRGKRRRVWVCTETDLWVWSLDVERGREERRGRVRRKGD